MVITLEMLCQMLLPSKAILSSMPFAVMARIPGSSFLILPQVTYKNIKSRERLGAFATIRRMLTFKCMTSQLCMTGIRCAAFIADFGRGIPDMPVLFGCRSDIGFQSLLALKALLIRFRYGISIL